LDKFVRDPKTRIEIAGPFETEGTGRAVETALISALPSQHSFNKDPGQSRWRFRPLGVPLKYADRLFERELGLKDFLSAQMPAAEPVLFVIVTDVDHPDGREGYDPANPPKDAHILERVDRWWQLQHLLPAWIANPEKSPGLLVGVVGPPHRRIVIASTRIDRQRWAHAECHPGGGGKIRIPLTEPMNIDVLNLRARRVAASAGLRFGGIPAQFYVLLGVDGVAVGGNPPRKKRT
jgi:hypothetical protein